jgi:hypothetical protein
MKDPSRIKNGSKKIVRNDRIRTILNMTKRALNFMKRLLVLGKIVLQGMR